MNSFSTPIAHLVNLSVKQSIFQNAWKSAVVVPPFKAGDSTDVVIDQYILTHQYLTHSIQDCLKSGN